MDEDPTRVALALRILADLDERSYVKVSVEQRWALVQGAVLLDGLPARIMGVRSDFARIVTLDGARGAEWSWPSVVRICASGGRFVT